MRISVNTQSDQPKIVNRLVTLKEPTDGTGFKTHQVYVSYKLMPRAQADALAKESDVTFLKTALVGWGDPKKGNKGGFDDEEGNPLPFNDEMIEAVCETMWVASGLARAYFDAAIGGRAGN
jgi:hypothetical protein